MISILTLTKQEYLLHIFRDVTEETLIQIEEVLEYQRLFCWVGDTLFHHWGPDMHEWVYQDLSAAWVQAGSILCCEAELLPEEVKNKAFFNQEGYFISPELNFEELELEVWAVPVEEQGMDDSLE